MAFSNREAFEEVGEAGFEVDAAVVEDEETECVAGDAEQRDGGEDHALQPQLDTPTQHNIILSFPLLSSH